MKLPESNKIKVVAFQPAILKYPGSCHLDRASNFEIDVECQIFVTVIFLTAAEFYNLRHILGTGYLIAKSDK